MYYHCSTVGALTCLQPQKPLNFDKPSLVYMTTSVPMALMYGIRNFEYTYGYTRSGQIYYEEYFPDALRILYGGKSAYLYECRPKVTETTSIPNEVVSPLPVEIVSETFVPDVLQALLEQERLGTLVIWRYEELSPGMLEWIFHAQMKEIQKRNLLQNLGPMADYMKLYYPEVWAAANMKNKTPED